MKWLVLGTRPQFVEDIKKWFAENSIQYSETVIENGGIAQIFYLPIGKEQKNKCIEYITYRCNNNLL